MFGKSEVVEAGDRVRLLVDHISLPSPPLSRGLCFHGVMTQYSFPSVLSAVPLTLLQQWRIATRMLDGSFLKNEEGGFHIGNQSLLQFQNPT